MLIKFIEFDGESSGSPVLIKEKVEVMWEESRYIISLFMWLGYIFCFYVWITKNRIVNSFLLSFFVLVVFKGIMWAIEPLMFSPTGDRGVDRFIWYFGFAFIEFLAMYTIYYLHKVVSIKFNRDGIVIVSFFALLMFMQFIRYLDRQVFGSDILGEVYGYGIPAINIMILVYILFAVVMQSNEGKVKKC